MQETLELAYNTDNNNLIIPEYRIHLLNKNKKIIEKIESVKNLKDLNGKKDNKIKALPSANEKKKKRSCWKNFVG